MNGTVDHHAEQDKPSSEAQILHVPAHLLEPRTKIMMMRMVIVIILMMMGHEYICGTVWMASVRVGGGKDAECYAEHILMETV
jgi:hypothetical protein